MEHDISYRILSLGFLGNHMETLWAMVKFEAMTTKQNISTYKGTHSEYRLSLTVGTSYEPYSF